MNKIYPTQLIIRRKASSIPTQPTQDPNLDILKGIYERASLTLSSREGPHPFNKLTLGIDRYVMVGTIPTPVRTLFIPSYMVRNIRNTIHIPVYKWVPRIEWDVLNYDQGANTIIDVVEIAWDGYNKYRKISETPYKLLAAQAVEALYWIVPESITTSNLNNILNVTRVENGKVLEISPGANFPADDSKIKIYF